LLVKNTRTLAITAASSKHEPLRSFTENILSILCSTSTSQQQFLPFSLICNKQLFLHTWSADGYLYYVTIFRGVNDCVVDISDRTADWNILRIIVISLPHYTPTHLIKTYLCSVMVIQVLQSGCLSSYHTKFKGLRKYIHRRVWFITHITVHCLLCPSVSFGTSTEIRRFVKYNLHFGIFQNILTQYSNQFYFLTIGS